MGQAFLSLESYLSSSFSMQITRCGTCCLGSLGIHWNSGSAWQSPGCCWQAHRHEVARDCADLCSGKTVVSQDPGVHTLPERKQSRKVSLAESPHMNKTSGSSWLCTRDWGCWSKQGNTFTWVPTMFRSFPSPPQFLSVFPFPKLLCPNSPIWQASCSFSILCSPEHREFRPPWSLGSCNLGLHLK